MPLVSPEWFLDKYIVKENDILIARTGASVGKCYLYKQSDGKLIFAGFLMRLNIINADSKFTFYQLCTEHYRNWITSESARTGQPGVNLQQIKSFGIPSPQSLREQHNIASALTSIDNLLLSLDKLIEKKKLIKQGAMQELLTGKKRLPGFTGEWVERQLGEILDYEQPIKYITNNTNYVDTGIPVLTAGKTFILGYVYENTNIYTNLPVIIFDDFTTDCKYVDFGFKVKSSAIKMLKEKEGYNIKLIFEYLKLLRYNTTEHKRQWINTFSKELVYIPSDIKEQNAIANVLSSMDKEIESLEGKKAKYEQIKQGMMQQLLTGKIRLIS